MPESIEQLQRQLPRLVMEIVTHTREVLDGLRRERERITGEVPAGAPAMHYTRGFAAGVSGAAAYAGRIDDALGRFDAWLNKTAAALTAEGGGTDYVALLKRVEREGTVSA